LALVLLRPTFFRCRVSSRWSPLPENPPFLESVFFPSVGFACGNPAIPFSIQPSTRYVLSSGSLCSNIDSPFSRPPSSPSQYPPTQFLGDTKWDSRFVLSSFGFFKFLPLSRKGPFSPLPEDSLPLWSLRRLSELPSMTFPTALSCLLMFMGIFLIFAGLSQTFPNG